jgi:hypothetical protein
VTASKEKTVSINHTARGLRHIAVTAIAAGAIAIGAGVATLNAVALADVATATNNSVKSEPGSTPGSGATGTLTIAVTAKWNHAAQQISNSNANISSSTTTVRTPETKINLAQVTSKGNA